MKIHFIRHGKTEANDKRLYCGFTDIPLSEGGAIALSELRSLLPPADIFISSGMKRAAQTLDILFGTQSPVIIDSFREMNFGAFEMRSHEELRALPKYNDWLADFENVRPPSGENLAEFRERVLLGLDAAKVCAEKSGGSATVVAHGGVIAVVMDFLFCGQKKLFDWVPECGRGYSIYFIETEGIETVEYKQI